MEIFLQLIAGWRTGSSFLGKVLSFSDDTFYHYEPFHLYGIKIVRKESDVSEAMDILKQINNCSFPGEN